MVSAFETCRALNQNRDVSTMTAQLLLCFTLAAVPRAHRRRPMARATSQRARKMRGIMRRWSVGQHTRVRRLGAKWGEEPSGSASARRNRSVLISSFGLRKRTY